MNKTNHFKRQALIASVLLAAPLVSHSAIVPDRTRVIFNGNENSITVTLKNGNATLPYLAQAWLEDDKFAKDTRYFTALPPLQRIEPKSDGQVKVQPLPAAASLPQDRESLFYFNVREIPPKSDKPNTLQLALQTRIKFFYRPVAVARQVDKTHPWQTKLTLTYQGDGVIFDNPTPFYLVISNAGSKENETASGFKNLLIAPREKVTSPIKVPRSAARRWWATSMITAAIACWFLPAQGIPARSMRKKPVTLRRKRISNPVRKRSMTMLTRWKMLVLLCGGFVTGTEAAGTKTVQLELHLVVTQPPPCTVGGASVEFGDVLTTKVGDASQTKPVGYSLNCDGRASDYLKLQIQGTTTTISGEQVLQTSVQGLGIRIQQAGNKQLVPVGITDWLNFTLSGSNGPELEAVPVKEPTTQLAGGDFNASATLVVDYQ